MAVHGSSGQPVQRETVSGQPGPGASVGHPAVGTAHGRIFSNPPIRDIPKAIHEEMDAIVKLQETPESQTRTSEIQAHQIKIQELATPENLQKMTRQERYTLSVTLLTTEMGLESLNIPCETIKELRHTVTNFIYINEKRPQETPAGTETKGEVKEPTSLTGQPTSSSLPVSDTSGQPSSISPETPASGGPEAQQAAKAPSSEVQQLTAAIGLLRKGTTKLKKEEETFTGQERTGLFGKSMKDLGIVGSLLGKAKSSLGMTGRSKQSTEAGTMLIEKLSTAIKNFDSLSGKERAECYEAIVFLEQNEWFKGCLSTLGKTEEGKITATQFDTAKTTLLNKLQTSCTSISTGVTKALKLSADQQQAKLLELKKEFESLQGAYDWKSAPKELQEAYGSALKAVVQMPLLDTRPHGTFQGMDSSTMKPLTFEGETVQAKSLLNEKFWTDGLRQQHTATPMTQQDLTKAVVLARNPALSSETQQYLLAGRPPKKCKDKTGDETCIAMNTKAGDKTLLDHNGLITEQEASMGSGVVVFARTQQSSVLSAGNSSMGVKAKLIGVMHDAEDKVQYIDAVVVSTAHLDFEQAGKGDAHALALEEAAVEGSPFQPTSLTEKERKDPAKVKEYNQKCKQYQVFLYTKSGRLPAKGTVAEKDKLTYETATTEIGKLIEEGKSVEEIDTFLEGKFITLPNGELCPMEMIFRKYLETTSRVYGGLEGGGTGYTYSMDPPGIFVVLFDKDPRLITRMQTLSLAYLTKSGATFPLLQALGLSTYLAPSSLSRKTRPKTDAEGLKLLKQVIPQAVDKEALFERDSSDSDFKTPVKEVTLADGKKVKLGVLCVNDLRDPVVFYGSDEKDGSTEGCLAITSDYARVMGAIGQQGMHIPVMGQTTTPPS